MSGPSVIVAGVYVDQDQVCVSSGDQDPANCGKHDHVDGSRDLVITVRLMGPEPGQPQTSYESSLRELVGMRCRLVPE